MTDNDNDGSHENEITERDRRVAEWTAEAVGTEPDYEMSANARRELDSQLLYMRVYDLPMHCASALVKADDHERYARNNGWLTPTVQAALDELRRLAWAKEDNPYMMLNALTASFDAIHVERMKPSEGVED